MWQHPFLPLPLRPEPGAAGPPPPPACFLLLTCSNLLFIFMSDELALVNLLSLSPFLPHHSPELYTPAQPSTSNPGVFSAKYTGQGLALSLDLDLQPTVTPRPPKQWRGLLPLFLPLTHIMWTKAGSWASFPHLQPGCRLLGCFYTTVMVLHQTGCSQSRNCCSDTHILVTGKMGSTWLESLFEPFRNTGSLWTLLLPAPWQLSAKPHKLTFCPIFLGTLHSRWETLSQVPRTMGQWHSGQQRMLLGGTPGSPAQTAAIPRPCLPLLNTATPVNIAGTKPDAKPGF